MRADMSQEQQLARVFVELADTLVADFDVIDFLHLLTERCVDLLAVDAVGILLTDQQDSLQLVAASTQKAKEIAAVAAGQPQAEGELLEGCIEGGIADGGHIGLGRLRGKDGCFGMLDRCEYGRIARLVAVIGDVHALERPRRLPSFQ